MRVKFKRERSGGVQTARVQIDGSELHFNHDTSTVDLEENTDHTITWLLIGPTGARLKVTMAGREVEQTLVDVTLKHEHGSQHSGSKSFQATEPVS